MIDCLNFISKKEKNEMLLNSKFFFFVDDEKIKIFYINHKSNMSFLLILLLSLNIFFLHSKQIKQNPKNICSLIDMFREKCWKEIPKIPKYIVRNYEFIKIYL